MLFELVAVLTFSGELNKAEEHIRKTINEANLDLLKRGVPRGIDGGATVTKHDIDGDMLKVNVISDRYVRAHDAILRLRKKFSEDMGKRFKMGVREVKIIKYTIRFDLDREPRERIKVPYVEDIQIEGKKCTILLKDLTEEQLSKNFVDRIIKRIEEKIDAQHYQGKEELWNLIWSSGKKDILWNSDPTEEMVKKGWIKQGPTKGKWFYRPQAARILRCMEEIAFKDVLEPMGFQEVIESFMVPFDVWQETGHMEGIPNEVYYVCEPITRDPHEWEEFIDHIKISKEVPLQKLRKLVTPPKFGICYAQCPLVYWSLRNQTIAEESLPLLIYDRSVPSARYESGGRHGIERVDEFHRIEPVYIGTKEQLVELKERFIERYTYVFENILELEWRMANVAPFYLQQAGNDSEDDDEVLGTVDFEAYMPYRGSREDSEWLEFQNLSLFKKYTKAFNIKSQTEELYSGCSGIGLERWAAAFLAQKGIQPDKWPEGFQERCGDLPKGLNLL